MRLAHLPDALVARLGAEDVERLLFQQAPEGVVDVLFVVDDEDALAILARAVGTVVARGEDEPLAPELMRDLAWTTHGGNERLYRLDQRLVKVEPDLLLAVAPRLGGIRMHLDEQAVGVERDRRLAQAR